MSTLLLPALDPGEVVPRTGTVYPPRFAAVVNGRTKRSLTVALGLTQFGVNVTELAPGAASSLRHHHSKEDEFVWVLQGCATLVTDEGRQRLEPGMCAGFPAASGNGHQLINETAERVVYLEVGSRDPNDEVFYPDVDLKCGPGRYLRPHFTTRDGEPLDPVR